jgi:hypothetical protein
VLDASVWAGVNRLVDSYLNLDERDEVVVVFTSDTRDEACWLAVALEQRRIRCSKVWMIPLQDPEFHARLAAAIPDPSSVQGSLTVVTLELETLSHDSILRSVLASYPVNKARVYRAISASGLLFSKGLGVTPDDLSGRNTALLERLMPAQHVRVTTKAGTDLRISFDSKKYHWISNRGVWRPGKFVILPAGEVATYPASIDGIFVADFAFNANFRTKQDPRLDRWPVKVWVEGGRAVRYECEDPSMRAFLDECFRTDCATRVGEVGFGTNYGVNEPVPLNSHLNERHPGLHLGFGESNQSPDLAGYECETHLDLISTGGQIWFEGDQVPLDLMNVEPSSSPHPRQTRDEDAYSSDGSDGFDSDDCCGMTKERRPRCADGSPVPQATVRMMS